MFPQKNKSKFIKSYFMNLAFNLANIHNNMTGTNPSVGCLVCKNDKILSYGLTGVGGSPHAEYSALINLKKNNNLDCYVSLEPCHHQGKNPPCTKSIVNKNVKNLYYSETDNDPRVQGKGLEFLQNNKIRISKINNIYKNNLYKNYNDFNKNFLPKVYAKVATTENYYSFIKNRPQITNIYSKKLTHILRSEINAILIGVNTHNMDNPLLNCRINGLTHLSPARFIIDPNLRINGNSELIMSAKKFKTYIFYSDKNNNKINYLKNKNIYPIYLPLNKNKQIDCKEVLVTIGLLGYKNVLIEGGYNTIKRFIDLNLIDIFYFFKNNEIISKKSSHSFKNIYMILKKKFKNIKRLQQVYLKDNTLTVFQK
jgi:diaminohydroxyphosphoribosylaminopyrimidine deaminase / 5-amino-6-(5-phosphoribosylamino)uracil reductase